MRSMSGFLAGALALVLALAACGETELAQAKGNLELLPARSEFGAVLIGRAGTREIRVRNRGRATAKIVLSESVEGFTVEPASTDIPSGTEKVLVVTFRPKLKETYQGVLRFAGESESGLAVEVVGEGTDQALDTEVVLDFGEVELGDAKVLPLDVASLSDLPLDVSMSFRGTEARAFTSDDDGLALPAEGTGQVGIKFTPLTRGPHAARLVLQPCSSCTAVQVTLLGHGITSLAEVQPVPLDFGTVSVGTSTVRTVRVTNRGDYKTYIVGAELLQGRSRAFGVEPLAWPVPLFGPSVDVGIRFTPEHDGAFAATLRLQVGNSFLDVPIAGNAGEQILVADPMEVDLGVLLAGNPNARIVTLSNVGPVEGPLGLSTLSIDGEQSGRFDLVYNRHPPEVATGPLPVEVVAKADRVGTFTADLIAATEGREAFLLRVPVRAQVVESTNVCNLSIQPTEIRFGVVSPGTEVSQTIEIRNTADNDCYLWDLEVVGDAAAYRLEGAFTGIHKLGAEESVSLTVRYAPTEPSIAADNAVVRFRQSSMNQKFAEIPLSAFASAERIVATPAPLDFGTWPVGSVQVRGLELRNAGSQTSRIVALRLAEGSSDELSILTTPELPRMLAAGESLSLPMAYIPRTAGPVSGRLEIWLANTPEPLYVAIGGSGDGGVCGAACDVPVASCPGEITTWVHSETGLDGAGLDAGGGISCSWSVDSAPAGSATVPTSGATCHSSIVPDLPGDYVMELTVEDGDGNTASCQTTVHAKPYPGLWVETRWNAPDDVDLHLFHSDGGLVDDLWFSQPWDVHFGNFQPSWDGPGLEDDPRLERDSLRQGPESIRLDSPTAGVGYGVAIHWFGSANGNLSLQARTRVWCGDEMVADVTSELPRLYTGVVVGAVIYDDAGACTWTPVGTSDDVIP